MADFPKCQKDKCAFFNNSRCVTLIDTDFNGKPCPFFKTDEEFRKGLVEGELRKIKNS